MHNSSHHQLNNSIVCFGYERSLSPRIIKLEQGSEISLPPHLKGVNKRRVGEKNNTTWQNTVHATRALTKLKPGTVTDKE